MSLSVVIPFYNRLPELLICLNSLAAFQQTRVEYIVNDDHSPDVDARAVIHPAQAQVWRNDVNMGFAGNCNIGATHAHGDIIMFANQDIYAVHPHSARWDAAILAAFDDPAVGIVGARLLFPEGGIQSAGGEYDAKGQPYHRCLGYSNPNHWEVSQPREVSWTTGAAMAIRRDLFERVGGFDTSYLRGYFEDTDVCEKVKAAGFKVWYEPAATFIHRTGTSGGNPKYFQHNAQLFRQRWVASGKIKPDAQVVRAAYW